MQTTLFCHWGIVFYSDGSQPALQTKDTILYMLQCLQAPPLPQHPAACPTPCLGTWGVKLVVHSRIHIAALLWQSYLCCDRAIFRLSRNCKWVSWTKSICRPDVPQAAGVWQLGRVWHTLSPALLCPLHSLLTRAKVLSAETSLAEAEICTYAEGMQLLRCSPILTITWYPLGFAKK